MRTRLDFQPYFRALADRLALKDWRIEIVDEPPTGADAFASVVCIYGRKWARIRLADGWLADTEEFQRLHATHELIHTHFASLDHLVGPLLPRAAKGGYNLELENGVDGLADAVAPFMPLPSEILGPLVEKIVPHDGN